MYEINKQRKSIFSIVKLPSLVAILFVLEIVLSFVAQFPNQPIAGSAQAVSLTQGDGLAVYGVSANTTPQVRTYTGATNVFSSASSTVSGSAPLSLVNKTSPTKQEAIIGYINSSGTLQIACYNGTSYTNEWSVSVGGTGTDRRFDIAYETSTGDVMVLYSTNTATTNELAYRTKLGSTGCGAANWASATNLDPVRTSGVVQWVKMAWDRRSSSNLITAIWADANSDLSAQVWSGTAWSNEPSAALATTLDVISAAQDVEDFDVEYESLSGDVKVVWGVAQGNNNPGVRESNCTGGISSCTWSAVATPATFNDDATNLDLSANPLTDEMVFASIGQDQHDLQIGYWSGSAWTNDANVDTSSDTPLTKTKKVATGWVKTGSTTRSIIVYADGNGTTTNLSYYTGNSGTFSAGTDFTMSPVPGAFRSFDIQQDPYSSDRILLTYSDANNDLFAKRLVITAGPTFTWTNADSSSALETSLGQAAPLDFSYAFWRYAPRFNEAGYRWFENNNSTNAGVATANPSASDEFVRDMKADSQYLYAVGHDTSPGNNQWRIEKRYITNYDYDTSFGTSGVMANNPSSGDDRALELDIDTTSMYIAGYDVTPGNARWRIEKRSKSTGFTDFGFGTLGVITTDVSGGDDYARSITADSSYIYIAGVDATSSNNRWRIEKRNKSNGTLVSGFGTSGVVTNNPSAGDDQPLSIVVSGSYIYTAGYDSTPGNKQIRIEKRLTSTGALDTGFGVSGVVTSNPGSGDDVINKVKTDGTYLYVAGYDSSVGAANLQWRFEKRNVSDGSLVGAFGSSGVATSNPTSSNDELYDFDYDGTYIYLGGSDAISGGDYEWRIEKRSISTGSLDGSFGISGVITSNPGSGLDRIRAVKLSSTSILTGGAGTNSTNLEWRFEKRSSTGGALAKVLAAQNTAATLTTINDTFRLRQLITVTANNFQADQSFKLQFATKSGTCDTAFSGETYTDITASTAIAYYNNVTPTDGTATVSNPQDPTTGNTINYQTYEEANNFTNSQSTIPVNQDGLWDFSLYDKTATVNTSYCFRVVKSDGVLLDTYTQVPEIITAPGALTTDIVDTGGSSVSSPLVTMSTAMSAKNFQTTTGTLGTSSEKVRVNNTTSNPKWQITIAASGGVTSLWNGTGNTFDFNDPTANAIDGADADSKGGQMTINPAGGSIAPKSGCTNTGLSLGSSSSFSQGVTDAISLMSAGASAGVNCFWDLLNVAISQTVPSFQPSDTYSRAMTITITAL
ncbi:MAG: hypothetical protein WC045_02990 [Patescibacteria group bacterium]